jgi:hypothetical protein
VDSLASKSGSSELADADESGEKVQ